MIHSLSVQSAPIQEKPFQRVSPPGIVTKIALLALVIFPVLSRLTEAKKGSDFCPPILDFKQRPPEVKSAVDEAFNRLSRASDSSSNWRIIGEKEASYDLLSTEEYPLVKHIVNQAPASQKDFYVLDIGAGNFGWGKGLAKFLVNQDLGFNKTVHIIGVRGENQEEDQESSLGQSKLYNLGGFKIEELSLEFPKHDFLPSLENQVDLIVSSWCFRHLVDPVGTFVQAYNLLRPESGVMLTTGFLFLKEQDDISNYSSITPNLNLMNLAFATKAPFLMRTSDDSFRFNSFILQRPDANPCSLEMSYGGMSALEEGVEIASHKAVRFTPLPDPAVELSKKHRDGYFSSDHAGYGDKNLHDWLSKRGAFFPVSDEDRKYYYWNFRIIEENPHYFDWSPIEEITCKLEEENSYFDL